MSQAPSGTAPAEGADPDPAEQSPNPVSHAPQSLEDRYGTGSRRRFDRRFAWLVVGVAVAAGLAFLVFGGWADQSRVSQQDIGFTKQGAYAVEVKFSVSAPANTPVACVVEALNTSKATVGWKVVEVPPSSERDFTVTTQLVTTSEATAGTAKECWVVETE